MPSRESDLPTLAFVGGTGPEGRGLALRFAAAGFRVIVGSRQADRARDVADGVVRRVPTGEVEGAENADAALRADIVVLTVPYSGIGAASSSIRSAVAGKLVVSTIVPIEWHEGRPEAKRPVAGSAAQELQQALPEAVVASAFQTLDAHQLADLDQTPDTDVIVCSDDKPARDRVIEIAGHLPGVRAYSGGRLSASRYVEECTALLITLNRIYKVHTGFHVTGLNG